MCLVNISKRRPSDFNGLHSCRHDDDVQFYAFDILVSDDEDVRRLPLSMRKAIGAPGGWYLSVRLRAGRDRPRPARLLDGLEGMVSKHRESAYRGGRSDRWIKVKNRQHPAFSRVQDQF
jgi:bifunctional non-homologous end joining protein LigD